MICVSVSNVSTVMCLMVYLQYSAQSFSLHCTTNNKAAIALYTKKMFVIVRQLEAHYHFDGMYHDALELIREPSDEPRSCSCRVM